MANKQENCLNELFPKYKLNMSRSDRETSKMISEEIVFSLKPNVYSVLLYGSAVDGYGYDLDLLVILDRKQDVLNNTHVLRRIREQHSDVKMDLQLLYREELVPENYFSLDAHGAFIVPVLKSAITLFGENPFLAMEPDPTCVATDVLQKIQYYLFRARQAAFGCGVLHKDTNSDLHRKKIKKIMQDILLADGICVTSDRVEKEFFLRHQNVLDLKNLEILAKHHPLSIDEALPIYESLYHFALTYIPTILFQKNKPLLSRHGDVVFEFLSSKNLSDHFVILCEGIPSVPNRRELMQCLSNAGWNVLYPRYRGTWESAGNFLEKSPRDDIRELCDALHTGLTIQKIVYQAEKISLLGSSFGGGVALTLADHPHVDHIVGLSPVIDFVASKDILLSLQNYLQNQYPGAYRFASSDWLRLCDGELLKPIEHIRSVSSQKICIFAGAQDPEIFLADLQGFCEHVNVPLVIYEDQSHLSFSKLTNRILRDVLQHISS